MLRKVFIILCIVLFTGTLLYADKKGDLDTLEATIEGTFKSITDVLGRPDSEAFIKNRLKLLRGTLRNWQSSLVWDIADVKKADPSYRFNLPPFPAELNVETYNTLAANVNSTYKKTLKDIEKARFELGRQKYFTAITIMLSAFFTFNSTFEAATGAGGLAVLQLPSNLKGMVEDAKRNAAQIQTGVTNI